ncbi:MAG: 2-C-methyl-D-erythritol 4-phosphate cytidylyltransferase [Xanthomonadales bacterium]|nr:2-C-methyl-D-erythritol 4-phosphate cytidylyltransferase [Xanthomonadales bacterium]
MSQARIHALLPAAGQSLRFGGTIVKQYASLLGKPVMAHSIAALRQHQAVAAVTVAISADDGLYNELMRPNFPEQTTIIGGDSRAQTVLNGLQFIAANDPEAEWVLVHDAARPCLSADALNRLIEWVMSDAPKNTGHGAILAVPVSDTLKQASEDGQIIATVDRSTLWAAQTPQLFRLKDLLDSLTAALQFGPLPSDEAQAMERCGHPVHLVEGSVDNIKITRAEDLAIAEAILLRQQASMPQ